MMTAKSHFQYAELKDHPTVASYIDHDSPKVNGEIMNIQFFHMNLQNHLYATWKLKCI